MITNTPADHLAACAYEVTAPGIVRTFIGHDEAMQFARTLTVWTVRHRWTDEVVARDFASHIAGAQA